jgi:hypothetical protein
MASKDGSEYEIEAVEESGREHSFQLLSRAGVAAGEHINDTETWRTLDATPARITSSGGENIKIQRLTNHSDSCKA